MEFKKHYYVDGVVMGCDVDNKRQGMWCVVDVNTNIPMESIEYDNGLMHGPYCFVNDDLTVYGSHIRGKKSGIWSYFENEHLHILAFYDNDECVSEQVFNENGSIHTRWFD